MRRDPGRLDITNMTLKAMVRYAYDLKDMQISGGPGWFDADHWDISAQAGGEVDDDDRKKMLQSLLTERFKMTCRRETKELPVYALVVGKNGSKLKASNGKTERILLQIRSSMFMITGEDVTLPRLADELFNRVGRMVIDRTGIEGRFDYKLQWVPDPVNVPMVNGSKMEPVDGPSIFTAVQEQLGLKLESAKSRWRFWWSSERRGRRGIDMWGYVGPSTEPTESRLPARMPAPQDDGCGESL